MLYNFVSPLDYVPLNVYRLFKLPEDPPENCYYGAAMAGVEDHGVRDHIGEQQKEDVSETNRQNGQGRVSERTEELDLDGGENQNEEPNDDIDFEGEDVDGADEWDAACLSVDASIMKLHDTLIAMKLRNGMRLFHSTGTNSGELKLREAAKAEINSYFTEELECIGPMQFADALCELGVSSSWGCDVVRSILFCTEEGSASNISGFIAKKKEMNRLSSISRSNLRDYQNANTEKACKQAISEFVDFCIYGLSTDSVFGLRAEVVEEIGLKIQYSISIHLEDFGITSAELKRELEAKIGELTPVSYSFVPEKPRRNQPGSKKDWEAPEFKEYRVVGKRRDRNVDADVEVLNLLFTLRHKIFNFARDKDLKIKPYSLHPEDSNVTWAFRSLILESLDMFRTFSCDLQSSRRELYNILSWTNCTYTILASLKMYFMTKEPFGRETEAIVKYAFESYQARKVKLQSMERILTPEMLKYNADHPARNLVLPISASAKETYSLFLLTESVNDAQAGVVLLERNMVHTLLERPITVNTMRVDDAFHPMNAPVALATGVFCMRGVFGKRALLRAAGRNSGLASINRNVLPNFDKPQECPVFTSLAVMVQSDEQAVGRKKKIDREDRFLDSLCLAHPRRQRPQRKDGGKVVLKVSESSSANKRLLQKFRESPEVPASNFARDGFITDLAEQKARCSADLKLEVCGSDNYMAIYSEKKAAANKCLRHPHVNLSMLEARAYGDTLISDAKSHVRSKRKSRNIQYYTDPNIECQDLMLARILANHDPDDPRDSQIWLFASRTLSDETLEKIKMSLFASDSPWARVCQAYLDSFAILSAIAFTRFPAELRDRITLFNRPVWQEEKVLSNLRGLGVGVKLLLENTRPACSPASMYHQLTTESAQTMEVTNAGDIASTSFIRDTRTVMCSTSALSVAALRKKTPLELKLLKNKKLQELDLELTQRLATLDHLKQKAIAECKQLKAEVEARFKLLREEEEQQALPERVAKSVEVGGVTHGFLSRCGFIEKHSEAARGSGISSIRISCETYKSFDGVNKLFTKNAGRKNCRGEKLSMDSMKKSLVEDLTQFIALWHLGTTTFPPVKDLPRSFTAAVQREALKARKLATAYVKGDTSTELTPEVKVFLQDTETGHTVRSNVYNTFVENIAMAEKVEKVRAFACGKSLPSSLESAKNHADRVMDFLHSEGLKMKGDFDAHRGRLNKSTYFSFLAGHEAVLASMKTDDWQPSALSLAFGTQNLKSKRWFYPVLSKGSGKFREFERTWTNPRPQAPTRKGKTEAAKAKTVVNGRTEAAKAKTVVNGRTEAAKAKTVVNRKTEAAKAKTVVNRKTEAAKAKTVVNGRTEAAKAKTVVNGKTEAAKAKTVVNRKTEAAKAKTVVNRKTEAAKAKTVVNGKKSAKVGFKRKLEKFVEPPAKKGKDTVRWETDTSSGVKSHVAIREVCLKRWERTSNRKVILGLSLSDKEMRVVRTELDKPLNSTSIISEFGPFKVWRKDIATLGLTEADLMIEKPRWLGETIVDAYFARLEKCAMLTGENYSYHCSSFYRHLEQQNETGDLPKKRVRASGLQRLWAGPNLSSGSSVRVAQPHLQEKMFFPILSNGHWTLLVACIKEKCLWFFDSLRTGFGPQAMRLILQRVGLVYAKLDQPFQLHEWKLAVW